MAHRKFKKPGAVNKVDGGYTGRWNGFDSYEALNVKQLKKILERLPESLRIWIKAYSRDFSTAHLAALHWVGEGPSASPFGPEDATNDVYLQVLSPSCVEANRKSRQEYMAKMRESRIENTHPLINEYENTLEHEKQKVLWKINLALQEYEAKIEKLQQELKNEMDLSL